MVWVVGAGLLIAVIAVTAAMVLTRPSAVPTQAQAQAPVVRNFKIQLGEGKVVGEVGGKDKLTGEYHRWEPGTITVFKGDKVTLQVLNPRKHTHSLAIPEFGVDTGVLTPRGGKKTVEFTADQVGVYEIKCGLDFNEEKKECDLDHKYMIGHLVVLDR